MYLPDCIVKLIKSFLPLPGIRYEPSYYMLDYMRTDGWEDVLDLRSYGDY